MKEEWIIENLTIDYVNIIKMRYIEEEGQKLQVGQNWRTSAQNTLEGIEYLTSILPEKVLQSILIMWQS